MKFKINFFMELRGPVWLMQPIPYLGEKIEEEWIYEPKIDGWRLQVIKYKDGRIEFWGRRLEKKPNWSCKLGYISENLKYLPSGTLLDCELYTDKGRHKIPSLFKEKPDVTPIIFVFDIIFIENEFIGEKPLSERKKILEGINFKEPLILLKYRKLDDIYRAYKEEVSSGNEGIIIKKWDSIYKIAKDVPIATIDWRKIK
jgi:ATP-dependent DNA ligase